MNPAINSFPALCLQCALAGILILGCQSPSTGQIEPKNQHEQLDFRRDLLNLWDGSWVQSYFSSAQSQQVIEAGMDAALKDHREAFSSRAAVERDVHPPSSVDPPRPIPGNPLPVNCSPLWNL